MNSTTIGAGLLPTETAAAGNAKQQQQALQTTDERDLGIHRRKLCGTSANRCSSRAVGATPSTVCACFDTMMIPMAASMPCTTAAETHHPARLRAALASTTPITPATTMTANAVIASRRIAISKFLNGTGAITIKPAAGPLMVSSALPTNGDDSTDDRRDDAGNRWKLLAIAMPRHRAGRSERPRETKSAGGRVCIRLCGHRGILWKSKSDPA